MKIRYDTDAQALYVDFSANGERVARTVEVDEGTLVDLDRFGFVIGIEVIKPDREWPMHRIFAEFKFRPEDEATLKALWVRGDTRLPFTQPGVRAG